MIYFRLLLLNDSSCFIRLLGCFTAHQSLTILCATSAQRLHTVLWLELLPHSREVLGSIPRLDTHISVWSLHSLPVCMGLSGCSGFFPPLKIHAIVLLGEIACKSDCEGRCWSVRMWPCNRLDDVTLPLTGQLGSAPALKWMDGSAQALPLIKYPNNLMPINECVNSLIITNYSDTETESTET